MPPEKHLSDPFWLRPAGWQDALAWMAFIFIMCLQPYYLHHEIIMMETGIHLPALNALFHGGVPYRDFFFLRGPMELYVPALMMWLGGKNSALLPMFYYGGTMLTLFLCGLLAVQVFRTRLIAAVFIPVLIARTFPRISYYYWGGMRYALGFLVLFCLFYFFKTERKRWMFATGIACALASLTTVEAGISTVLAAGAAWIAAVIFKAWDRDFLVRSLGAFGLGFLLVAGPYFMYLVQTHSLADFLESTYVVVAFSNIEFPGGAGVKPETLGQFAGALWMGSPYFKFMTPVFCFLSFAGYLWYRRRTGAWNPKDCFWIGLMVYGLVLYAAAFRKIEGHHFEMALQAEKFLLFMMLEEVFLFAWARRTVWLVAARLLPPGAKEWRQAMWRARGVYVTVVLVVVVSWGFAVGRFAHRFPAFKIAEKKIFGKKVKGLSLLEGMDTDVLHLDRVEGNVVPRWQAEEINGVVAYLKAHTQPGEAVFCFPEVGNFNFWADRPFIGRFPVATFSWFYEPWYQELLSDFRKARPRYVVMTHVGHRTFPQEWYFRNPRNVRRFKVMTDLILKNYEPVRSFEAVAIYRIRSPGEPLRF